jgi:uncharacterized membrane protein YhaH (DUF805 family)
MSDVFISYAREDNAQAERIARGLEAQGLSVFWDNEIPPGQTWADYIEGKLNQCNVAVVLWSEHSTKSQWVREEARMGRSKLIPAKLDAAEPPFGFGDVQAADLSHWGGDYNHPEWARFSRAVVAKVRGGEAPFPPPPPATEPAAPQAGGWQTPPPLQHQPQSQQQSSWQTPPPSPNGQHQGWGNQSASQGATAASPIAYIQKCLSLYVDGKGRARRSEYGWFFVFCAVVGVIAAIIDIMVGGINPYTNQPNSSIVVLVAALALIAPTVSAASRRLHDCGQTGWLAALVCIPYVGWIPALVFIFLPGTPGPNPYGPDPKAP